MRSPEEVLDAIDEKVKERRGLSRDLKAAARVDKELSNLYDELRQSRAAKESGDRKTIVKRARIERELEKLMT